MKCLHFAMGKVLPVIPLPISFTPDLEYKPSHFKEKDMACAPKFTQPLMDRSAVAGYSTAISCAVRGFPKVSM